MKRMVTFVTPPAKVEATLRELQRNGGYWTKMVYGSEIFDAWQKARENKESKSEPKDCLRLCPRCQRVERDSNTAL